MLTFNLDTINFYPNANEQNKEIKLNEYDETTIDRIDFNSITEFSDLKIIMNEQEMHNFKLFNLSNISNNDIMKWNQSVDSSNCTVFTNDVVSHLNTILSLKQNNLIVNINYFDKKILNNIYHLTCLYNNITVCNINNNNIYFIFNDLKVYYNIYNTTSNCSLLFYNKLMDIIFKIIKVN